MFDGAARRLRQTGSDNTLAARHGSGGRPKAVILGGTAKWQLQSAARHSGGGRPVPNINDGGAAQRRRQTV